MCNKIASSTCDAVQQAECQQYKHQVGRLEREAQQWVSHCLIVEAASQRTAVQLEKVRVQEYAQRAYVAWVFFCFHITSGTCSGVTLVQHQVSGSLPGAQ